MPHEIREVDVERYALLCQETSPKRWFGNMEMTSNCDVTNSEHQIQMTTIWLWTKTPPWKFSANATDSRYKIFVPLRKIVRHHANFSTSYSFHPAQNGKFFNTDWLVLFMPMQWTHFQSWQMGKCYANLLSWPLWRLMYAIYILIRGYTIYISDHLQHIDSVSAHGASHHACAPHYQNSEFPWLRVEQNRILGGDNAEGGDRATGMWGHVWKQTFQCCVGRSWWRKFYAQWRILSQVIMFFHTRMLFFLSSIVDTNTARLSWFEYECGLLWMKRFERR